MFNVAGVSRSARLFLAILLFLAVACSRPASYEEFVRAEDATEGVYEFVLPLPSAIPGEAEEPAFDISFYTASMKHPLQLDIHWLVAPNALNDSTLRGGLPRVGEGEACVQGADNQYVECHQETVWFPSGEHRALYRSGVRLAGAEACYSFGTVPEGQASAPTAVVLRVRPVDPPEDFRGLGIICKRNDGTR